MKNYKTIKIAHWASSGCGPGAHQAYWAPRAPRAYWAPQAHRAHRAHRACWAHPGRPSGGMCGWTHSTGHFFLHTSAAKSHEISGLGICIPPLLFGLPELPRPGLTGLPELPRPKLTELPGLPALVGSHGLTWNGSLGPPGKQTAKNPKFGERHFSFKIKHFFLTRLLL